jgi:hypothetical protein
MKCIAPWYELNISAPDNYVSACCYYSGSRSAWSDESVDIDAYWNSDHMQATRDIDIGLSTESENGCTNCHYFRYRDTKEMIHSNFLAIDEDASNEQKLNWKMALEDYNGGLKKIRSKPLRYYINFGFNCNLECIQCMQVPVRKAKKRQVQADLILNWKQHMKVALDISVIGGEPFAIPEAVKFVRDVVEDSSLDDVRLFIYTNGTLHHKHMDTLKKKRKLSLCVSLDSMGSSYEFIRKNGSWAQVEKNLLDFIEVGRSSNSLDWGLTTTCGLMKAGVSRLPEFAAWCVKHKIPTMFFDLITAPGIETVIEEQDIIGHPHQVLDVPHWDRCFTEAAGIFRDGGQVSSAERLEYYRDHIFEGLNLWYENKFMEEKLKLFEENSSLNLL